MKKLLITFLMILSLSACATRTIVCSDWKEIQTPDGQIYRERNCYKR